MTDQEILEGNKLIGIEFMQIPKIGNPTGYDIDEDVDWYEYGDCIYAPDRGEFLFHQSWGWQIPVWSKLYHVCMLSKPNIGTDKIYNDSQYFLTSAIRKNYPLLSFEYLIYCIQKLKELGVSFELPAH